MNFNEALIAVKGSTALSNPRTTFMGIISIILGIASLLHVQISGVTFTGDPWFMIQHRHRADLRQGRRHAQHIATG